MVLHYALALELGVLDILWLALLITAGGHITPLAALFLSVLAGSFVGVVAVVRTRRRVVRNADPEPIRTRGPIGYAGPGSLGGTESALKGNCPHGIRRSPHSWRRGREGRLIPRVRRVLKPLSSVLLVVGVLLAADAAITLLWKEPLSAIYAQVQQGKLDDGLAKLEGTEPTATDRKVLSHLDGLDRKLAYAARALNRRTDDGAAAGPHPDAQDRRERGRGGGHGHRRAAARARATTPARRCRARAARWRSPGTARPTARGSGGSTSSTRRHGSSCRCRTGASPTPSSARKIVPPTATWVTHRVGYDRLVLSACHPLYSAAKRIIVFAKLVRTKPRNDRLA